MIRDIVRVGHFKLCIKGVDNSAGTRHADINGPTNNAQHVNKIRRFRTIIEEENLKNKIV